MVIWTPETPVPDPAVQEVFAVTVLPGRRYPELINDDEKLLENSFVVPDAVLAGNRQCATISEFVRWVQPTDSLCGLHPPYRGPRLDAMSGQGS